MYQVTIVFNTGGFNRFSIPVIPRVGEEVAIVHDNGEQEVYKITKVKHRAYSCGIKMDEYAHESAAMIWGELVDLEGRPPFTT